MTLSVVLILILCLLACLADWSIMQQLIIYQPYLASSMTSKLQAVGNPAMHAFQLQQCMPFSRVVA
jgi:hypothetical protein